MSVHVVDTVGKLDRLAGEWRQLLRDSTCNHIFLTHPWGLTWWEFFGAGRQLNMLAVRQNGENGALRGLAPLYLDQVEGQGVIKFVGGTDLSDHLDIISQKGQEQAVQQAVLEFLDREGPAWERMSLWNMPEDCRAQSSLVELAQARGWRARLEKQDLAPYIPLPKSWEGYLTQLDSKERHEIRRKLRRAERLCKVEWSVLTDPAELRVAMDDFLHLFRLSGPEKQSFMDDRMEGFFRTLVDRTSREGWVRLYFIRLDGRLAAGILTFDYANNVYVYNSGYDPDAFGRLSPAIVLFAHAIGDAIERGRQRFDLLRGDEPYKYRLGAIDRVIYRLEVERHPESAATSG